MFRKLIVITILLQACSTSSDKSDASVIEDRVGDMLIANDASFEDAKKDLPPADCSTGNFAEVTNATTTGSDGNYQFSVTVKSTETGCDQYANWWEVLDEEGKLVYRRILGHSHVSEQPFTRSGGPVDVKKDDLLFIRAHMHPDGYGRQVLRGTIDEGFSSFTSECTFAQNLSSQSPLPTDCAF